MMPDSVVLERTLCFGTCPAYRVSIDQRGIVRFHSLNPGDTARRAIGRIDAYEWQNGIMEWMRWYRVIDLPDTLAANKHYCPVAPTDFPWAFVSIFQPGRSKRIEDYQGCVWRPLALVNFEEWIDKIAKTRRWVRPSSPTWVRPSRPT
jgi:hypothetical protein